MSYRLYKLLCKITHKKLKRRIGIVYNSDGEITVLIVREYCKKPRLCSVDRANKIVAILRKHNYKPSVHFGLWYMMAIYVFLPD